MINNKNERLLYDDTQKKIRPRAYTGPASHVISNLTAKKLKAATESGNIKTDPLTGKHTLTIYQPGGMFEITGWDNIETNAAEVMELQGVSVTTKKIYRILTTKLSNNFQGDILSAEAIGKMAHKLIEEKTTIFLTVPEVMEELQLKNRGYARECIQKARQELLKITIKGSATITTWDKTKKKPTRKADTLTIDGPILNPRSWEVKKQGFYAFFFEPSTLPAIGRFSEPYSKKMLPLSDTAYLICEYLNGHYYQNKKNNKGKNGGAAENVLKLETIAKSGDLPTPDQVKNYKYVEKIETPLLKALQEIQAAEIIKNAFITDSENRRYNFNDDNDAQEIKGRTISQFLDLRLHYEIDENE